MRTFNGKQYIEKSNHDITEMQEIMKVLLSDEGCEWDRAQTFETMKECLKNETNEVLNAIDNKDFDNLKEELGDVLLQVVMQSAMAEKQGKFTFNDVVQGVCEKLIRRHPHVFGDEKRPTTPEESLALWRKVKALEKAQKLSKK